jgi:hypothetical protein
MTWSVGSDVVELVLRRALARRPRGHCASKAKGGLNENLPFDPDLMIEIGGPSSNPELGNAVRRHFIQ